MILDFLEFAPTFSWTSMKEHAVYKEIRIKRDKEGVRLRGGGVVDIDL